MPVATLKTNPRISTSSCPARTMEQSKPNENPSGDGPAKIANADTQHCQVANDLDDSHQASHRWQCKVFIGCKASGTETGIWCG
jgi:hypothetical protein